MDITVVQVIVDSERQRGSSLNTPQEQGYCRASVLEMSSHALWGCSIGDSDSPVPGSANPRLLCWLPGLFPTSSINP